MLIIRTEARGFIYTIAWESSQDLFRGDAINYLSTPITMTIKTNYNFFFSGVI